MRRPPRVLRRTIRWPRPGEVATRIGLRKDYLNRLVRHPSVLTFGHWRNRGLLHAAEGGLKFRRRVSGVSGLFGFTPCPRRYSRTWSAQHNGGVGSKRSFSYQHNK
jgi:hypothetical protein